MKAKLFLATATVGAFVFILSAPAFAQWLNYPTPGIPRLPNGKPNLEAPAPTTADGKPDLSGLYDIDSGRLTGSLRKSVTDERTYRQSGIGYRLLM